MQRIYLRFFLLYNERSEQHYAIPTGRTGGQISPGEKIFREKNRLRHRSPYEKKEESSYGFYKNYNHAENTRL